MFPLSSLQFPLTSFGRGMDTIFLEWSQIIHRPAHEMPLIKSIWNGIRLRCKPKPLPQFHNSQTHSIGRTENCRNSNLPGKTHTTLSSQMKSFGNQSFFYLDWYLSYTNRTSWLLWCYFSPGLVSPLQLSALPITWQMQALICFFNS